MENKHKSTEDYADACRKLCKIMQQLGYPEELAYAVAQNLHSSKMIDRMIVYLNCVKPKSADEIVDEMLALMSDRDRWVKKKEAEYCNEKNNEWMNREKDQ